MKKKSSSFDIENSLFTAEKLIKILIDIIMRIFQENASIYNRNNYGENAEKIHQGELQAFLANFVDKTLVNFIYLGNYKGFFAKFSIFMLNSIVF